MSNLITGTHEKRFPDKWTQPNGPNQLDLTNWTQPIGPKPIKTIVMLTHCTVLYSIHQINKIL